NLRLPEQAFEPGRDLIDRALTLDRALDLLAARRPVRPRQREERDHLRRVPRLLQPLAVPVEIELQQPEPWKDGVELPGRGGLVEALARFAPRRADVDEQP